MRKDLYPHPKSSRYVQVPDMVKAHLPTAEEFAAAKAYFELHPEKFKYSAVETGEPISYLDLIDSRTPVTLTHSFVKYRDVIYAIHVDPSTSQKTLLSRQQRPAHLPKEKWRKDFTFATACLRDEQNFTKLPKSQKIVTGYTFFKIPTTGEIVAQMRSRTCLGMGVYGVGKLVINEQGQKRVVKKQYLRPDMPEAAVQNEYNFSLKTGLAFALIIDPKKNTAFQFMPFFLHTLETFIKPFSQDMQETVKDPSMANNNWVWLLTIFASAITELQTLHFTHRIIHRDIKPDNVFVAEDSKIKFGDFGLSRTANEHGEYKSSVKRLKESLNRYTAPEICDGEYSFYSDIFSLGVIYQIYYNNLLKSKCLPSLNIRPQADFEALIAGMTCDNVTLRLPHKYIVQTLSNLLAIVNREIDLPSFIVKSNDLTIRLRVQQMLGIVPDPLLGDEKLFLDDFLEDQFLRVNFENHFCRTEEMMIPIKKIFHYYYEAERYIQSSPGLRPDHSFAKTILETIERHRNIQKEIRDSRLFDFDGVEIPTPERLSALLEKVETIAAAPKIEKSASACCAIS